MTREELIQKATDLGACLEGIEWMKTHEISDLNTIESLMLDYRQWVLTNIPEIKDEIQFTKEELNKCVTHPHHRVRIEAAKERHGLDVLVSDVSWSVRRQVAIKGYGLDKLVSDPDWLVRVQVARQGYGLDVLVSDPDCAVRVQVAVHGFALDALDLDPNWRVRLAASNARETIESNQYSSRIPFMDSDARW